MSNEAQNKFDRHNAARNAQRKAEYGITRADAITKRDEARAAWQNHGRSQAGGGLLLDQRALSAKAALIAERARSEPKAVELPASTLDAIAETWLSRNPNYYPSPFNNSSMKNFLAKAWDEQQIPPSIELMDAGYEWLTRNGHLENDPRIPRKRGDVARASMPRAFEYTTPEETKALEEQRLNEAIEKRANEDSINRALPLEELRRRAQTGRGVVSRDALMRHQG